MTADDLMRLVNRYVEACDDLGDGLFEKPLSTTDTLHAKATELHGQILAEVYRLHAEIDRLRLVPDDLAAIERIKDDIKARAAALHEGCRMPMAQAMELAHSEIECRQCADGCNGCDECVDFDGGDALGPNYEEMP